VKIVEELIAARIERSDENGDLFAGGYDFLTVNLGALEFRGGRVLVADDELDLDSCGYLNLARNELIVFHQNRKAGIICQSGGSTGEQK
jgi:hypothetical protein